MQAQDADAESGVEPVQSCPKGAPGPSSSKARPASAAQIFNLSVGLFGVQVVWGLQNVNTSRIFQTLGADVALLPILWIAGPVTGLLVQPLVGWWSDRHRGRWGRRRPFIAAGAIMVVLAMLLMGAAKTLPDAVLTLWLLTAAINFAMQPFRSLAADRTPRDQRTAGFALQVCFICTGAVVASALPWVLVNWFGVSGAAPAGRLPPSVTTAYGIGAAILALTVAWTLFTTREAPTSAAAPVAEPVAPPDDSTAPARAGRGGAVGFILAGAALAAFATLRHLRPEVLLIAALLAGYGAARLVSDGLRRRGRPVTGPLQIVDDVAGMPRALRRLAITQFLTWFGLFAMWIYSVPAVALHHFGAATPGTAAYNTSADWVGVLFALYDGVAAIAALGLPWLMKRVSLRVAHAACLLFGAAGMAGFLVLDDPHTLWLPAIGIGIAWTSILAIPYVLVANAAPPQKIGVYMGIHNIFLVVPQLVAAACLGAVVDRVFGGRADWMLALAAGSLALAGVSSLLLPREVDTPEDAAAQQSG